jgi:hypothetical protein
MAPPTTVHEQGSTSTTGVASTTSTVHEQGFSTTTTTMTPSSTQLPFTGSGRLSLGAALAALGVGTFTLGLARLGRAIRRP